MPGKICIRPSFLALLCVSAAIMPFLLLPASCRKPNSGDPASAGTAGLRYGLTTEPETLDPLNPANTADGRSILFNVFEGLVKPDSSGALVPAVAESYAVEEDGEAYVFSLRPGVVFHDGSPLRAEDVAFSINTASEKGYPGLERVRKAEIVGPGKIRVTLKEKDPEFLPYLTVGIAPENNGDRERNPIGSGPFMIESFTPQQSLVLARNPRYWQSGLPYLDRVTIVFAANSEALLLGLKGGNIEAAGITGAMLAQLQAPAGGGAGSRSGQFDAFPWYSNTVQLMALNNAQKPLDDARIRKAINYALDIPGIIETAFYGKGEVSGSPLIPGLKDAYEGSLRDPYPRDLEKAKTLMAEAGYGGGFSLEITVPSIYSMHVDTAQVIVNQLADAGIRASIRLVDWGTWLNEVYRGRKYEATIISLDAYNVSPRSFLGRYISEDGSNFINYRSSEYDSVYREALLETDEAKRISLYRECQKIISGDAASVFIQDILGFRVFPEGKYGGLLNYPLYVIDFSSVYRR